MSGASEPANGQASDSVPSSRFLVDLAHSGVGRGAFFLGGGAFFWETRNSVQNNGELLQNPH